MTTVSDDDVPGASGHVVVAPDKFKGSLTAAQVGAAVRAGLLAVRPSLVVQVLPVADGADLFICESFGFAEQVGYHMTWRDIERNIDRLGAKRVLLTHMGDEMLANSQHVRDPRVILAEDGMRIDI